MDGIEEEIFISDRKSTYYIACENSEYHSVVSHPVKGYRVMFPGLDDFMFFIYKRYHYWIVTEFTTGQSINEPMDQVYIDKYYAAKKAFDKLKKIGKEQLTDKLKKTPRIYGKTKSVTDCTGGHRRAK